MRPDDWEGQPIGPFVRLRADRIYLMDFGTSPTDDQLDAHFDAFGRWCDENEAPVGGVVFLRSLLTGTAAQRKRMADFEKRMREHDAAYLTACGIVAPNAITRGLVTAVFWMAPPVYPTRFFSTFDEALHWVVETMSTK